MTPPASAGLGTTSEFYDRHALPVRIMHWINVVCLTVPSFLHSFRRATVDASALGRQFDATCAVGE